MNTNTTDYKISSSRGILVTLGLTLFLSLSATAHMEEDNNESDNEEWLEEIYDVQEFIKAFDLNNDQLISTSEIQNAINRDLSSYDQNADQQLSLNEFEGMWNNEVQQETQKEFSLLDTNQNQAITVDELVADHDRATRPLFTANCIAKEDILNNAELNEEAAMEIATMDTNRNGSLSYEEFSKTEYRDMIEAFQDLDEDGNQHITKIEYQSALSELAEEAKTIKQELPIDC